MKNFFFEIKEFFQNVLFGAYWGFICGLGSTMAVFTIHHLPFWCFGVSLFFVLFHLSDFKKFYEEKNWLAFSGRYIALLAITAFIVSLFAFTFQAFGKFHFFDIFIPLLTPIGIFAGIVWVLLERYGQHTVCYRECAKIIDGLYALGIFWRY